MDEAILLFLYHQFNDVTQRHFDLLCRFHARSQVVPLTFQYQDKCLLPGSEDIAKDSDYGWPIFNAWADRDKILLRWFRGRNRPQAQRYIFCEYDVRANCAARDFFGGAWDADVAAARLVVPADSPQWPWWQQANQLGVAQPLRTGISPMAASLWSHEALTRLSRQPQFLGCHCELRMGTLSRLVGLTPVEIPGGATTVSWRPEQDPVNPAPKWFHPVKR